jgi:tRNA nucleotidyltransferase (CCA-adding enzyme)
LKADGWLSTKYEQARQWNSPGIPSLGLYLALLVYRMGPDDVEEIITPLRLRKSTTRTLRDTIDLKNSLGRLASTQITASQVYTLLIAYAAEAVVANVIVGEMPPAVHRLNEFINKLRYIKPTINGEDLKKLGVAQGPGIKDMLHRLLEARLDGKAATRRDEEALVRSWLAGKDS